MSDAASTSATTTETPSRPDTKGRRERSKARKRASQGDLTTSPAGSSSPPSSPKAPPSSSASTAVSPKKRRSSSTTTKDTATTHHARDTAGTQTVISGDLTRVMKAAEAATSLFDLRRAFFQGDPTEKLSATTLKELNTVIRTRLAALTTAKGETLASIVPHGLDAVRKAFDLQAVLGAIAGRLGADESTKFTGGPASRYTEAKASEVASRWISQIMALRKAEEGGESMRTDPGVTSGVPSAFETRPPIGDTKIKDPKAFDKLILKFVREDIKGLLAGENTATATKSAKSTRKASKTSASDSARNQTEDAERGPSRARSTSPSSMRGSDAKKTSRRASSKGKAADTTTPAESTGPKSSKASGETRYQASTT